MKNCQWSQLTDCSPQNNPNSNQRNQPGKDEKSQGPVDYENNDRNFGFTNMGQKDVLEAWGQCKSENSLKILNFGQSQKYMQQRGQEHESIKGSSKKQMSPTGISMANGVIITQIRYTTNLPVANNMYDTAEGRRPTLRKPQFVKIKDIENGQNGYNVYVKVLEVKDHVTASKDNQAQKISMIDVLVADQTGAAWAFFKGDQTKEITVGATIAIRNGARKIIKNHISLEVNLFSRVTIEEDIDITPDITHNISDVQIKFEPKTYNKRPGRKEFRRGGFQDRRFPERSYRRDDYRYEREDKDDRNNRSYRDDRYDNQNRDYRDNRQQRGGRYNQYNNDQYDNKYGQYNKYGKYDKYDNRQGKYDTYDKYNNKYDKYNNKYDNKDERYDKYDKSDKYDHKYDKYDNSDDDRQNRESRYERDQRDDRRDRGYRYGQNGRFNNIRDDKRNEEWEDRRGYRPRSDYRDYDRQQRDEDLNERRGGYGQQYQGGGYQEFSRQKVRMTKINQINPGQLGLNLNVKVMSATSVSNRNGDKVRFILGDETGIVKAVLFPNANLICGRTVAIFGAEAKVVAEHIEIQQGRVTGSRNWIDKVNEEWNLSEKSWVPAFD